MAETEVAGGYGAPRRRARWLVALAYLLGGALWVLASGLEWTAALSGLVWASVLRGIYVAIKNRDAHERSFLSPWLFFLAALLTVITLAGQRISEEDALDREAIERNVVASGEEVSAIDRCVTKVISGVETAPREQVANIPPGVDVPDYAQSFCARAETFGALSSNGDVRPTPELMAAGCIDALMASYDAVPAEERRFSAADFEKFSNRYCSEAVDRGLIDNSRTGEHTAELEALQESILGEMLRNGEITELSS